MAESQPASGKCPNQVPKVRRFTAQLQCTLGTDLGDGVRRQRERGLLSSQVQTVQPVHPQTFRPNWPETFSCLEVLGLDC